MKGPPSPPPTVPLKKSPHHTHYRSSQVPLTPHPPQRTQGPIGICRAHTQPEVTCGARQIPAARASASATPVDNAPVRRPEFPPTYPGPVPHARPEITCGAEQRVIPASTTHVEPAWHLRAVDDAPVRHPQPLRGPDALAGVLRQRPVVLLQLSRARLPHAAAMDITMESCTQFSMRCFVRCFDGPSSRSCGAQYCLYRRGEYSDGIADMLHSSCIIACERRRIACALKEKQFAVLLRAILFQRRSIGYTHGIACTVSARFERKLALMKSSSKADYLRRGLQSHAKTCAAQACLHCRRQGLLEIERTFQCRIRHCRSQSRAHSRTGSRTHSARSGPTVHFPISASRNWAVSI
jgi:hypothetical protein